MYVGIRRLVVLSLSVILIAAGAGFVHGQDDRTDDGQTAQPSEFEASPLKSPPDTAWDAEQQLIVESFLNQSRAINADDFQLFQSATTEMISIRDNAVPAQRVFDVLKNLAKEDPADYKEAYNPKRIADIRIRGNQADLDFRDTKTNAIQHFKFTKEGGIWKWSGLN